MILLQICCSFKPLHLHNGLCMCICKCNVLALNAHSLSSIIITGFISLNWALGWCSESVTTLDILASLTIKCFLFSLY